MSTRAGPVSDGFSVGQESAGQQRDTLQAAKAAGLLHKVTVADARQVLDSGNPAGLLAELTAAPVTPANVFLSEPYYSLLESLPPWSQLRCWHDRDVLLAAGLLRTSHKMIPCAGRVCGVGVAMPDLWRTRAPLGVEHGVDLTPCNAALGAIEAHTRPGQALALSQTAPVITKSVWQCGSGYHELTERVQLLNFDFSQPLASSQGSAAIRVSQEGVMHALVSWMEYQLFPDADQWMSSAPHLSGRPSYSLQAVQLLQAPVLMQNPSSIRNGEHRPVSKMLCRAVFDLSAGNISFGLASA